MVSQQLVHQNGNRLFVTSLDISNRFGKQHKDVLRAIDNLDCTPEFNRRNFAPISYNDGHQRLQRAFEITRKGFSFLCMGFTGPQAALWKERYIEAFDQMEAALRQPAALPAVAHSPRLDASLAQMAQHMGTLARGIDTVITQMDVTKKYIGLLEINQTGTRRVTAEVANEARLLKAEGMSNGDIARLLRISRTAVSLIVRDKYGPLATLPAAPQKSAGEIIEGWIEREQDKLADTLGKIDGGAA